MKATTKSTIGIISVSCYLSAILTVIGYSPLTWQYWAILAPVGVSTLILRHWAREELVETV